MILAMPVHVSDHVWREIVAILVLLALTVLPVSLAASFANARRPGMLHSALAVFLGGIVAQFLLGVMGASLTGLALSFLGMCVVYALVLEVSLVGAIGVAVLAFVLQILIAIGLAYLGLRLHGFPH
ncbi:MAG: hypothetical protein JSR34_10930 [Proteobacteria bacterium]|nr:hypothetical protein [Pseudomonadota bacterium]